MYTGHFDLNLLFELWFDSFDSVIVANAQRDLDLLCMSERSRLSERSTPIMYVRVDCEICQNSTRTKSMLRFCTRNGPHTSLDVKVLPLLLSKVHDRLTGRRILWHIIIIHARTMLDRIGQPHEFYAWLTDHFDRLLQDFSFVHLQPVVGSYSSWQSVSHLIYFFYHPTTCCRMIITCHKNTTDSATVEYRQHTKRKDADVSWRMRAIRREKNKVLILLTMRRAVHKRLHYNSNDLLMGIYRTMKIQNAIAVLLHE